MRFNSGDLKSDHLKSAKHLKYGLFEVRISNGPVFLLGSFGHVAGYFTMFQSCGKPLLV